MAYHFQVAKYGEDDMWTGVRLVGVAMMYHQCANSSEAIKMLKKSIIILKKYPNRKKEVERLTQHLKKWTSSE